MAWLLFGIFFLLLFLNVPIGISITAAAAVILLISNGFSSLSLLPDIMYASISKFTLLAIPFFILAGVIMEYAGVSKRLIKFADALVGHLRGGIALVTVLTAMLFAAISGSGPATVAALGTMLIPALVKNGYPKSIASGLVASSGSMGVVIPPSITFIIFAVIAGDKLNVSIGRLFIAGIIPGILLGIGFFIAAMIAMSRREKKGLAAGEQGQELPERTKASMKEKVRAFLDAFWGLLLPVIILGGIYSGVFTATEAAVVAVFYGLFIGFFVYKEIKLRDMSKILVESATTTAVIMLIIGAASVFAYIITIENFARTFSETMLAITDSKIGILLLINILLLIAGMFLEAISAFYLFTPILIPIILQFNIDPTVFGVFMVVNLAIGLFTPPVGVNLYVASGIARISLQEISRGVVPFVISALIVLMLVTYIPVISTWLPDLLGMK
jgi:C4-dicarboxylate transporter DctM subunit